MACTAAASAVAPCTALRRPSPASVSAVACTTPQRAAASPAVRVTLARTPRVHSQLACRRAPQPLRAAPKDASAGEEEAELIEMDAEEKMEKTVESTRRNFGTVRTGRANTSILDRIQVEYYGVLTPLKKMANAGTPDAQTITIQPFDKTSIKDIERALNQSDLGLTPSNDGNIIRLNIPQLTQERRKELTKQVGKLTEEGKVALRNIRRDGLKALEKLEKDKLLSEDQLSAAKEAMQKKIDAFVKQVDDLSEAKNKELMQV